MMGTKSSKTFDPLGTIAYRGEHGLTQGELADHLGVSIRSVSNWERGLNIPQPPMRARLAELLGREIWSAQHDEATYSPTPVETRLAGMIRAESARLMKTQQELADAAGLSQSQISKVMRAERPMTLGVLAALADELGLDLLVTLDSKETY